MFYRHAIREYRMPSSDAGSFYQRLSSKFASSGVGPILAARLLLALSTTMPGLLAFGCGSPVANLEISAPSSAIVGTPITVTVTAMVGGRRDTIFNSPIHFTSSDSGAVLPPDYAFTAADAGSHTFTDGVTLPTTGIQSIKATDPNAPSITATTSVTVAAPTNDTQ
jgi:hypothetical protein